MKQVYSVLTAIAVLLATTKNTSAQSCSAGTTVLTPTPGFGMNLAVNAGNDFSTTNQNALGTFPKLQTTELTSPAYYYTAQQPTIYFKYSFTTAQAGTTTTNPVIKILYGTNYSLSFQCTSSTITIANGTSDMYFSITPGSAFPAGESFKIQVSMDVAANDKAIIANTLSTNAFLLASAIILPVKLLSFNGNLNKTSAQLHWSVGENETAQKFEIQRSSNGSSFTTVGIVTGSQKSGNESYNFSENISSSKVIYRLKMYDNNSKAEYSKTIAFDAAASAQKSLQVLTNPVKEKLIISFSNETTETAQINIYDNLGRTIQKQSLNVNQGINTTTIALTGNYKSGLYIVELATKAGRISEKLIYSNQ